MLSLNFSKFSIPLLDSQIYWASAMKLTGSQFVLRFKCKSGECLHQKQPGAPKTQKRPWELLDASLHQNRWTCCVNRSVRILHSTLRSPKTSAQICTFWYLIEIKSFFVQQNKIFSWSIFTIPRWLTPIHNITYLSAVQNCVWTKFISFLILMLWFCGHKIQWFCFSSFQIRHNCTVCWMHSCHNLWQHIKTRHHVWFCQGCWYWSSTYALIETLFSYMGLLLLKGMILTHL